MSSMTQGGLDFIWMHFQVPLFHPYPSFKRIRKTLLQNVAFEPFSKTAEFSLVKRKRTVFKVIVSLLWQTIFSPICDQGWRCQERPSGIVSLLNATLWHEPFDRSITSPCICRLLKNRLWTKAEPDVSRFRLPGCRRWWWMSSRLCSHLWA